ncbi:major outer membrane protein [Aliarcobacter cryaerophilus]|uniref:major outer membrane protein n=1 Tax=Aliarcobacter cryaerophilus TaxID=28198 RepID=UPI0021B6CB1E|nr:major outer membrane protein [Aliarcobacter cryaerophilus]MCT7496650.1 major outer membrane protein [Aliarcobacter cryaerophilus]
MRKISKISLVAAVAVAGFSTANAQPLEEAIKNVDVSGSVVYRYDNSDNSEKDDSRVDRNRYKVGLNLSSKVNDYVKFNSRFIVGGADSGWATTGAKRDNGDADGNVDVTLSNAYFALTAIPNTVVNIGKQGLTTPYTVAVDQNGNEQNGTGILALTTVGPVTGGLGYFNNQNFNQLTDINSTKGLKSTPNTSFNSVTGPKNPVTGKYPIGQFVTENELFDSGSDIYVATLQGDLDFVKLEAWYMGLQDTLNSYTLAATSKIDLAENAKIGLEARYVNLKLDSDFIDDTQEKDNSMFRFAVDGKFSIVNARLAYTNTGKKGGLTAVDQDAKNTSLGWNISSNGVANADYYQAALGADILDNLNFTVHYGNLKSKETDNNVFTGLQNIKAEEVYGQLTYKMSKNLTTYLRYGNYEEKVNSTGLKTVDQNMGRLQVAYTF